jgi:hypothetical protein
MARGADAAEGQARPASDQGSCHLARSARGVHRRVERSFAHVRIGINLTTTPGASLLNPPNVIGAVHELELMIAGRRRQHRCPSRPTGRRHRGFRHRDPFRNIRMLWQVFARIELGGDGIPSGVCARAARAARAGPG